MMIKKFDNFVKEDLNNPQIIAKPKIKGGPDPRRYNKLIDYTYLREDANIDKIEEICKQAKENGFYSVCIRPEFVSYAINFLEGSEVKIVTVVSFHKGDDKTQDKVVETQKAISAGADEVDMVMNWKLLQKASKESDDEKRKDIEQKVFDDIRKVADACHGADSVVLKVIIESGELTLEQVKKACELCVKAGANYVKTSTGYATKGAEIDKVRFMRSILPDHIKIKASGGIRTLQDIEAFVNAGADRIGSSSNPAVITTSTVQGGY
jgi:deoxyribose-phosphate aldolase